MKLLLATLLLASSVSVPAFAVDTSISPLCAGDGTYAAFCSALATNKSMATNSDGPCQPGMVPNPAPPPACIPEEV